MARLAAASIGALSGLLILAGTAAAETTFSAAPSQLKPSNAVGSTGRFGTSVALSADGNTAVVGAPGDSPAGSNAALGAAWVFTRSNGVWSEQARLRPTDEIGYGAEGGSVAISADGNTVLVGGAQDGYLGPGQPNTYAGAAWVFARKDGLWNEQAKLTGSGEIGPTGFFGSSVALSADGSTALVGGRGDNAAVGAAWVFQRAGSTWAQPGLELSGDGKKGGEFGHQVALSGDGQTALVAGDLDAANSGAVFVFTAPWSQQSQKLVPQQVDSCAQPFAAFGNGIAASGNGNTALVGDAAAGNCVGGATVFTRTDGTWSPQGMPLVPIDEVGFGLFGYSVALTPDAEHAVIGGFPDGSSSGAVWAFDRAGSAWVQNGAKLTAGVPGDQLGYAVALSSDAATVLGGANFAPGGAGSGTAWAFAVPPVVTSLSPSSGPAGGGTTVTLTGTGLETTSAVRFGSQPATSVRVISPTEVTAVSPAGTPGAVDVTVTTDRGPSSPTSGSEFTYVPLPPAPKLSRVRQSHRRWRAGHTLARLARASRIPVGTVFSFRLNTAASVRLAFARGPHHAKAGTLTFAARRGEDRIVFAGRLSRRRHLKPGAYAVTLTATDSTGARSKPARLRFTIVPG